MILKNSYEQYLRKEYGIPNDCSIVIKRGFVISKGEELIKQDDPFKIRNLVYGDIKNEIRKIHNRIEMASDEIDDLLRLKENNDDTSDQIYNLQIELIVDDLFNALSISMRELTDKAYKSFIFRLSENSDDVEEYLYNNALLNTEIYGKINIWIESLKEQFVNKLNQSDTGLDFQIKSYFKSQNDILRYDFFSDIFETTTKSLFDDILDSIEDFFSNLKNKIDRLIFNIISLVQTEAKKIDLKIRRIEKYQIVLSDNVNVCDKCQEMDRQIFNVADLFVGSTAPPFHLNCGCTIVPYIQEEKDGSLREQVFIAANIVFELLAQIGPLEKIPASIYNWVKSSIWVAGTLYLDSINCPLAKEMYRLGMYGKGKGMSEKATNLMIEEMKNSKHLQEEIFKLTESGKNFDTGDIDFEFKKDEDTDLYYAVQNVNMRIIGTNLGDGLWSIKIKVWDVYDFTTFRNSLSFADLANNLGEAMQHNGMMTEYDTYTEYEYIWQRK